MIRLDTKFRPLSLAGKISEIVEAHGPTTFFGYGDSFRRKAGEVRWRLEQRGFKVEAWADPVDIVNGKLLRYPGATILEVSK